MTENCGNCRYSVTVEDEYGIIMPVCRRFPPPGDRWPAVAVDDWCGEWAFNKKLELESEGGKV